MYLNAVKKIIKIDKGKNEINPILISSAKICSLKLDQLYFNAMKIVEKLLNPIQSKNEKKLSVI